MALINLVQDVQQYFVNEEIYVPYSNKIVPIELGKRAIFKQGDSNRIVFIALGGSFGPAKINMIPRQLATYVELIEIHIWGFDGYGTFTGANPGNVPGNSKNYLNRGEEFHDEQCKILLNQLHRACYTTNYSNILFKSAKANNTPTENMHGRELIVTAELKTPLIDKPYTYAYPLYTDLDGYAQFDQGYQSNTPPSPAFVGEVDLDGNSTIADPILEEVVIDS